MARINKATETTTSTPTKRKFGVSTANIPASMPTIVDGVYTGNLKNIKADGVDRSASAIQGVEDLQLFDVVERLEWTKEKNAEGKSDKIHTGEYYIQGALTYMVELPNIPDVQDLPMDTMTIFGGRINIFFAKDEEGQWNLDPSIDDYGIKNRTWKSFQKAVGLTDEDINDILEATPFDETQEIAIPERLQDVPDALELLQACLFYKTFFTLIAARVNSVEVKVNVLRRNRYNSEDLENTINIGYNNKGYASYNSCGLLSVEG